MTLQYLKLIRKIFLTLLFVTGIYSMNFIGKEAQAFPVYAQQGYENPREATGRIVCANCHLAQKNIDLEVPKSILPNL